MLSSYFFLVQPAFVAHPLAIGKLMGSILVVAKDVSRGKALAPNRRNVLPCTAKTSRQRSCNQRVGCLLFSLVRIYSLVVVRIAIELKYHNTP